jgi:Protein of unknown function (DUF1190)
MHKLAGAVLCFALSGLVGCGQGAPQTNSNTGQPPPPMERGIFLSSDECARSGKLSIGECSDAILKASTEHDFKIAGYENESDCEAAFGRDRCEIRIDHRARPRVQAFLITLGTPTDAVSLYPPSRAIVGFQSASGEEIVATDRALNVSEAALALAQENAASPASASASPSATAPDDPSDALGRAASKIH